MDGSDRSFALARWQKLWADIADTLARAEGTTPPEPKAGDKEPHPER
jgi:hypothetical protein